jgi:hypothetical protein
MRTSSNECTHKKDKQPRRESAASQTRRVLSSLLLTTAAPSGDAVTEKTREVCPRCNARLAARACTSRSDTHNATREPVNLRIHVPSLASHRQTVLSSEALANIAVSPTKHRENTASLCSVHHRSVTADTEVSQSACVRGPGPGDGKEREYLATCV